MYKHMEPVEGDGSLHRGLDFSVDLAPVVLWCMPGSGAKFSVCLRFTGSPIDFVRLVSRMRSCKNG